MRKLFIYVPPLVLLFVVIVDVITHRLISAFTDALLLAAALLITFSIHKLRKLRQRNE